jgi:PBSX family phage terminase large subunit
MDVSQPYRLNDRQAEFFQLQTKFRAYVAGFGAGKTWAGCAGLSRHFFEFPGVSAGYFAPTYAQIRDIFYPTVEESFQGFGQVAKARVGNHEVDVYRGRKYIGTVLCRSMDDPASIVGFKIGHAVVDEIDVMTSDKARTAWRKVIARMRYKIDGLRNGIDVTTTPEGFKFTYEQFVKQVREKPALGGMYAIIQASTYDNERFLPDDYIPSLRASYPPQLIDAYINGQFVNLQTGSVYSAYNRELNDCRDTIQPGEILYIGMDFNVGKMAAVIHVKRDGMPRAVDEIINGYDTPDMIRKIKDRYWRHDGRAYVSTCQIRVYPDASGDSRKSVNASTTDIAMLRNAGFGVFAPGSNPPVKDRINAMNAMFCNADGQRRYLVNSEKCPTYAEALQQQAWADNGEPDKTSGHDHYVDAAGYFVNYEYPINARRTTSTTISMR